MGDVLILDVTSIISKDALSLNGCLHPIYKLEWKDGTFYLNQS